MSLIARNQSAIFATENRSNFNSELIASANREERLQKLNSLTDQIFPGADLSSLRQQIARSFDVPQVGEYHNEGAFMDSHIAAIFRSVDSLLKQDAPKELSRSIRDILETTGNDSYPDLVKYILLHDLKKPDCLTITIDGEKKEISWNQWQELLKADSTGREVLKGNAQALMDFCVSQKIGSISYYQESKGEAGKHGEAAAITLTELGSEFISNTVIEAIRFHEVGYQFQSVNIPTYERYFAGFSREAQEFALTGSFVDVMGSLGGDLKPHLENFLHLADSFESSRTFRRILDELGASSELIDRALVALHGNGETALFEEMADRIAQDRKLAKGDLLKELHKLRTGKKVLPLDQTDNLVQVIIGNSKIATYDAVKLESLLAGNNRCDGQISEDEVVRLLELVDSNPSAIGKEFGAKMRFIRPLLEQSKS